MIQNLIYFAIAGIALLLSGYYLVKSLNRIASFLHLSEFTAAFIIMAFATSIPELFVGISSAFQGTPHLSLGNILGSNIIDLTLISGIFVLLGRGIKFRTEKVNKEINFMFLGTILFIVLALLGSSLSRIDGLILIAFFSFNTFRLFRRKKEFSKKYHGRKTKKQHTVKYFFIFLLALVVLFVSSHFVVKYASLIATEFNVSTFVVGIFLISIATTLPELIFGINAILLKHEAMSIGDQAGAVFTHVTLIIGLVALIYPIEISLQSFLLPAIAMTVGIFIFSYFVKSGKELDIKEGLLLILFYVIFIILQIFIS